MLAISRLLALTTPFNNGAIGIARPGRGFVGGVPSQLQSHAEVAGVVRVGGHVARLQEYTSRSGVRLARDGRAVEVLGRPRRKETRSRTGRPRGAEGNEVIRDGLGMALALCFRSEIATINV